LKLTFERGRFVLSLDLKDDVPSVIGTILGDAESWTPISATSYSTQSLRAAARFRRHSDEVAGKIFRRTFMQVLAPPRSLPAYLDKMQKDCVRWVLSRSRSYLAAAPGAGKTCIAITCAQLINEEGQVLFVVPPTATEHWRREILMWDKRSPLISVIPESADRHLTNWSAEHIVVPDSMLAKPWVLEQLLKLKFKFVAVDEASRFKDPASQRSKALFGGEYSVQYKDKRDEAKKKRSYKVQSPGFIKRAHIATLMDGSPMPNRPMELWGPTYAMAPEVIDCMSQQDFGFKFCGPRINSFGAYEFKYSSNENELRERLQKNFMKVVTEDELQHPERRRSILWMNQDPRTPEMKEWEEKNLSKIDFSKLSEDDSQGDLATHRRLLGVSKIAWVASYVRERLEKGESVLLFAWHRDVCEGLHSALREFNPGLVMGGTSKEDRESTFESFQAGKCKLIVGNIESLGRIHNLQRADRTVFAEWSWTDETNKQAEKRVARRGNLKKFVRSDYVAAPNSMDEKLLRANFRKQLSVKRIIG